MERLPAEVLHVLARRCFIRRRPSSGVAESERARCVEQAARLEIDDSCLEHIIGRHLGEWVLYGSWALCWKCSSATERRLRAVDFAGPFLEVLQSCHSCDGTYVVPQPEDFPSLLVGLSATAVRALRPLRLLQGAASYPHAQGSRRHTCMTGLAWAAVDVVDAIGALPDEDCLRATAAFEFLMANSPPYQRKVQEHRAALAEGKGGQRVSCWALLEPFLEASLWPDLYFSEAFCDSRWAGAASQHASAKQSFLVKVRSPVLDYSMQWDLLQWHYDRHILARFCGRSAAAPGIGLKWALADVPEAPLYFYERLLALTDLHRQLGPASMLLTLAPGAYCTTWPAVVHHLRQAGSVRVLGGCVLESLHLLHILKEVLRGYLVGGASSLRGSSSAPLFFSSTGGTVRAWAARIEYQEGLRTGRPQLYHGTGLPHIHVVVWLQKAENTSLARWLRADVTATGPLRQAALAQQKSKQPAGGEQSEPSHWRLNDNGAWELVLLRNAEAVSLGCRMYASPLALAYVGHQDIQFLHAGTSVSRYMAKMCAYVTKGCTSMGDEWASHCPSGFHAARLLLTKVQPAEAQMVQALSHGGPFLLSCSFKRVTLGTPGEAEQSLAFQQYLGRPADCEDLCYLDYLRQFRTDCSPPQRYRRLKTGRVALAVHYTSKMSDAFFGQWLLAHVPCRTAVELLHPDSDMVPSHKRFFMSCRRRAPEFWGSESAVTSWLAAEAHKPVYVTNFLRMLRAWTAFTDTCLARPFAHEELVPENIREVELSPEQSRAYTQIVEAICSCQQTGEAAVGFRLTGPAGSGKSFVLYALLRHCAAAKWGALLCTPTGALADRYRHVSVQGCIAVDTVDAAFRLWSSNESWHLPYYCLVLVDEVAFLDQQKFDAVIHQWNACGRAFVLVVAGDAAQLQPPSGLPRATGTAWSNLLPLKLTCNMRALDADWAAMQLALRVRQPSKVELGQLVGDRLLGSPTVTVVAQFLQIRPHGVLLATRREDVDMLNNLAVHALHCDAPCLGTADCVDMLSSYSLQVFEGMRVMVTYNVDKVEGLVNGAFARVEGLVPGGIALRLVRNNALHVLHRVSLQESTCRRTGFPLTLAYSCTLAKVQGRTLPCVAILPRPQNIPGAGYVAISRVSRLADLYWLGKPTPSYFKPPL